jgi:hypothetical protein
VDRLKLITINSRADSLLNALDERYFRFAHQLPGHLQEIALSESSYEGVPGEKPFRSMTNFNPLITCTAWLFWETFHQLDDDLFLDIAEAGAFFGQASVLIDHLVDGEVPRPAPIILFRQSVYEHAVSVLRGVFPQNSPFWGQFDRLSLTYLSSLGAEVETQEHPEKLTYMNFTSFAGGKVSPMVITIAALAEASSKSSLLDPIETSLRSSYVAGQIHDDILDWEKDLNERHLTYVLTQLFESGEYTSQKWPLSEVVAEAVNTSWKDVDLFKLALEWFNRAFEAVDEIACQGWKDYLNEYKGVAVEHQKGAVAQHLQRTLIPLLDLQE